MYKPQSATGLAFIFHIATGGVLSKHDRFLLNIKHKVLAVNILSIQRPCLLIHSFSSHVYINLYSPSAFPASR